MAEQTKEDKEIEVIMHTDFFDRVIPDLELDWLFDNREENEKLEFALKQIGAFVKQTSVSQAMLIRLDKLISALKVHGYSFGDMTILADQLSESV